MDSGDHDKGFSLRDLDFELPAELIAQAPPPNREDAWLLCVERSSGGLSDRRITDLPDLLHHGDLLVLNDTRVLPAKFEARRRTGGRVGGLFLASPRPGVWHVLLEGSGRLKPGETVWIDGVRQVALTLAESCGPGEWVCQIDDLRPAEEVLGEVGRTPLPPYIRRKADAAERPPDHADRERYQTVYAAKAGAVAAPTAGLHLTERLLDQIRNRGVETAFVTLHVGVGTFKPITADRIDDHVMHSERYELPATTAYAINHCKDRGGRVVAVGTTTVRVLESVALKRDGGGNVEKSKRRNVETVHATVEATRRSGQTPRRSDEGEQNRDREGAEQINVEIPARRDRNVKTEGSGDQRIEGESCGDKGTRDSAAAGEGLSGEGRFVSLSAQSGETSIFIYPPYQFRIVNALLTNFHLPRSTLLALVMAFGSVEATRRAYDHAISQRYRFYSYGDAMFIA